MRDKMRDYIEREAILRKMQKIATEAWKMRIKANVGTVWNEVQDVIRFFPAADVRPVGCGRWELSDETPYIRKHYHPVACSNCHRAGMKGWNYCPNCGADMREES